MQGIKHFIVLGQTGSGKSFFLNMLEGNDGEKGSFPVATSNSSCTKEISVKQLKLFGDGQQVTLVDTPGFYDTTDKERQNKKEKPETLKIIEKLSEDIVSKLKSQVNRIFLCIAATDKFDQQKSDIIEIVKMFVAATIRIIIIITKFNLIRKTQQAQFKISWQQTISQKGFEDIIFFGDEVEPEGKQKLSIIVEKALPEKMFTFKDLTSSQKKRLNAILQYEGCFPLNTYITDEQGNQVLIKDYIQKLQNFKVKLQPYKQDSNCMLGFIEFNLIDYQNFISFDLCDIETNSFSNLEISPKHMLFVNEYQNFIPACDAQVGNTMKGLNCSSLRIIQKNYTKHQGFCSPLTTEGCFYANQVLVSSYTKQISFCTQQRAHKTFYPLILYRIITMPQIKQDTDDQLDQSNVKPIILPNFVKLLKCFANNTTN